jgi:prophage regulatory protein
MMQISEIPTLEEILRRADLPRYTGLQRTQIDDLIKHGKFPRPVRLSERRIGWLAREVAAWQASRIAARDKAEAA